jgi:hypothetical protein
VIVLTMWVLADGKKIHRQNDGELRLFPTKKRAEEFLENFWVPSRNVWKPKKVKVSA